MYTVDDQDSVVELSGLPQSCTGAPLPSVLATEHQTFLAYVVQDVPDDWDGTFPLGRGLDRPANALAIVSLGDCYAHFFGPPNDEAFHGHPLAERGLHPYGVFEVEHSSWLRALERMNSVHRHHSPKMFENHRHFIFAFHDSTFECIAESFEVEITRASIRSLLSDLASRIA